MRFYRIKDWDGRYENNRSRTVKDLAWVAIPNRHDGEGYSMVMAHPKAAEIFTAWILMLQVASRCQPRGSLLRDNGSPHTPQSLALKTRAKVEWFVIAFEVLASDEIRWIECVETIENTGDALDCQLPDSVVTVPCQSGDEEQNRMEWNGTERNNTQPPAAESVTRVKFVRPTLEEIKLHSAKLGLSEYEADKFFNFYESNGWKVGRNPMRSLQAAMTNWRRNWEERRGKKLPESNQTQEKLEIPRLM
jgi:hypothetical protein